MVLLQMVFRNFQNRGINLLHSGKRGKEGGGDFKMLGNIFWAKQKIQQYPSVYLFKYTDLVHLIRM